MSSSPDFDSDKVGSTGIVKLFRRFDVRERNLRPLSRALADDQVGGGEDVFVLEDQDGTPELALTMRHLTYHHIAQGRTRRGPFMLTFCAVCNSGMVFDPTVDGRELTFRCGGVYRGAIIVRDEATGSWWDHMTGECLAGAHAGKQLQILDAHRIERAAEVARAHPTLQVALPRLKLWQRLVSRLLNKNTWRTKPGGMFPPGFQDTLGEPDTRRPELELGLGVWRNAQARFYPLDVLRAAGSIDDTLDGAPVTVSYDPDTGVPSATTDDDAVVHAVFARWYGFSQTFPGCDIYDRDGVSRAEQPAASTGTSR